MRRMMSPIPLWTGSKSSTNRSMSQNQNTTLSSKEKKYVSNVERALQSFESAAEWADYIAFLAKLQRSLLSNPDMETTNWIPFDFQVSMTLSKCTSPSLPSGVHKKAIELYTTIFKILKIENMSKTVSLWLPGILPLMTYASISIKQELLDLYTNYICKIDPKTLRCCFKSILLSLFPALDDTTSEFFNPTMELIQLLKIQLNDANHFWQCVLLIILTSADKRIGAMEYITRKFPSFTIDINDDEDDNKEKPEETITKEKIMEKLNPDAVACLTPDSGLLVKALCEAMNDENLFVQRGFFDLLLAKLPLNSIVYEYLLTESDNELLFLHVTHTVLRKDMSLNRRLWNWLLGPEPSDVLMNPPTPSSGTPPLTRLQYFQKYSLKSLLNALSRLVDNTENIGKEVLLENYIKVCSISIAIMDKWEIGQSILPKLFIPILEMSKFISDNYPSDFDHVIKYSNEVFDGVETGIIWSKILDLINDQKIDLVLFILKSYNVADEDMIVTHIPLILLSVFASFQYEPKWLHLIEVIIKLIPQRALLPLDLADEKYLSFDKYVDDPSFFLSIQEKLINYYKKFDNIDDVSNTSVSDRPFKTNDLAAIYLGSICSIMFKSLDTHNSTIFLSSTRIYETLIQTIPPSKTIIWDIPSIREIVFNLKENDIDIELVLGITSLFKSLLKNLNKLDTLKLLKITTKALWKCFEETNGKYQVELVKQFWNLELIVGSSYIEAALCELLLELDFEERLHQFNTLWIHLNNDSHESRMTLIGPLYFILDELKNDVHNFLITKWIKSTINSGTLNKIFRMVCAELFNSDFLDEDFRLEDDDDPNNIDFNKLSYNMEVIFNLLTLDSDILNNFKLELCVIDNSKQIDLIQRRNWDISTYKSFLIVVLNAFMELKPIEKLNEYPDVYLSYLKCIRFSLKLINLLVDGHETNFNEIVISLIENCEENCLSQNGTKKSTITSYYLESITKMIKLSSKTQKESFIFQVKNKKNGKGKNKVHKSQINLLDFATIGISSCQNSTEFDNWTDLILATADYYPDLVFYICSGLISCICSKMETEFLPIIENSESNITLVEESICELIIAIEKILSRCHKHLGYIMSNNFGFGNMSNNGTVKESGFFGNVIQGVFQVEASDDRSELNNRRRNLIESFRSSIFTIYKIWIGIEKRSNLANHGVDNDQEFIGKLSGKKTMNYCNNKVKFRCKKMIENIYGMESLETIEGLIECYDSSKDKDEKTLGFKLVQLLDDSGKKIILSYILDSIISRVNYLSLDEDRRSSLTCTLNEIQISLFLIEYCKNLENYEQIEEVWNDIQSYLRDVFSNISYYKHLYPNILRFFCVVGWKLGKTKFGQNKRINKELSENLIKLITQCITIKIGTNTLSSANFQNNDQGPTTLDEKNSMNSNSMVKEKVIFRDDVCIALGEVIPYLKELINENDKLLTTLNNIISGIGGFILKNGSIVENNLNEYMIELLCIISEDETCQTLKVWKGLCNDILNDQEGFFKKEVGFRREWRKIMKNWILKDDGKLEDLISNKLIVSSSVNNSGTLLFNWNDEVVILNSNIPLIKKIIYLILINEKDQFISIIGELLKKLDDLFKAFREMTKQHCELESWILVLMRCIFSKFSENHLIESWTLIDKELFYLFNEGYMKIIEENEEENIEDSSNSSVKSDDMEENIFNMLFLQGCKLLDVLVVIGQEEFQLSEWIFINDNMDGIYGGSKEEVGILEKLSKSGSKFRVGKEGGLNCEHVDDSRKKVPMLKGVKKIGNIMELKKFYNMVKIKKYENEYEMKGVDFDSITIDLFDDLFM